MIFILFFNIHEVYREKQSMCTNDMLENGLVYLYLVFQSNVISASTRYTKWKS